MMLEWGWGFRMNNKILVIPLIVIFFICVFMSIIQTRSMESIVNNNNKSDVIQILKLIKKSKQENFVFENLEEFESVGIKGGHLHLSYKKNWEE